MTMNQFVIAFGLLVTTSGLVGCPTQSTLASLVTVMGNASASIAAIEGNPALAAKLQTDTQAAAVAVTNWKKGTPAQDAVQAINLVEADLNLVLGSCQTVTGPTPATGPCQYAALVTLALGTASSIIEILNPSAVTATPFDGRRVYLASAPKNAGQFKKEWNAIIAANPSLANAAIQ